MQCNAIQHSTAQHSTAHNTIQFFLTLPRGVFLVLITDYITKMEER